MDVNAAVAAAAAIVGLCTGVVAMLAFRISERERTRPLRSAPPADQGLPAGVDTVLSVLRSSAVVLDESDGVVKASSAAYALGLVRGGRLAVEPMLQMARRTRRDGEIRQQELDLPPRGRSRTDVLAVSARSAPLGSRLVLLLVEDLTEARRIEAVRRDFVANVSHELKTPAGALSLLSEAVLDAAEDPEAVKRFAGRMQTEATRLTSLVQELIDLSRVQDNDPLTNAELVSVDELVSEAIDRCRQPAASKHITMASGGATGLKVWGNRGQLAAALGNLVENAVNYSPPDTRVAIAVSQLPAPGAAADGAHDAGGRAGRAPAAVRGATGNATGASRGAAGGGGGQVEISVTDQGIGISDTDRDRIFERFYRVDPARSRATGGTGLGLAIVKHVVASHGGQIQVWSAEGEGSTFTLTLPEPSSARARHQAARQDRNGLSGALRKPGDVPEADSDAGPGPDRDPDHHPEGEPGPGDAAGNRRGPRPRRSGLAEPPGPAGDTGGPSAAGAVPEPPQPADASAAPDIRHHDPAREALP